MRPGAQVEAELHAAEAGGFLHVENCVVSGFVGNGGVGSSGVFFGGPASLEVKDSIMKGNFNGILVLPSSGTAQAAIDQVRLEGGGFGLVAREGSVVTVHNSVASANGGHGFFAFSSERFL